MKNKTTMAQLPSPLWCLFGALLLIAGCGNPLGSLNGQPNFHPGNGVVASNSASTLSASTTSLFADGATKSTVTVTLFDSNSDPVAGKTVSLSSSRGSVDAVSPATVVTSGSGAATFTVTSTEVGAAVFSANDTSDSLTLNQTLSVTFTTAAVFVGTDTTTQGTWDGVYGADGYSISQSTQSLPAYATVGISGNSNFVWASPTADVRALEVPASSRIAACWYNTTPVVYDINLTDNLQHRVAFYLLDWDLQNRVETLTVRDASTLTVLSTQNASGFGGGVWYVWKFTGHVQVTMTLNSGVNGVVSGIFFN